MRRSMVDAMVRAADPITEEEVSGWLRSPGALEARGRAATLVDDPAPGAPRRSRRRLPVVALAAALVLVLGAAAGAAAVLLGEPAPPQVKEDLRGVDVGFPADLRYNPDVAHARSVAATGDATLYYAELKDGGHCTEIVTSGDPRGAVCTTAAQVGAEPIELTIPFTDPVTLDSPVTIGGRVNASGVASIEVRYGGGGSDPIPLGDGGFFLFDVPSAHVQLVHSADFSIVALASDGNQVASATVPAIAPEPSGPVEDSAPITVDTISDGSDFTKVLGVRGRVNAEGATSLEFRYPGGATVSVTLAPDGSYDFDIPSERQGDLFHAPGTLIARDASGREVASAPVAAVAFWRAHQG